MDVGGMKDASHMHKLRGPQAGRCREGWLVIVAGSGCSRHRDSWGLRVGGPAAALAIAGGEDVSAPGQRRTTGRSAGLLSGDPHLRDEPAEG